MPTAMLTINQQLHVLDCCTCGMTFAMTAEFQGRMRENHEWFHCPRGHRQHYSGPSNAERANTRAKAAEEAAERLREQLKRREQDVQTERRQHAATKGRLTKERKRAAHGVCPCCTRSFANVQRHMANQHPEFVAQVAAS